MTAPPSNRRVLLVDDDADIKLLTRTRLELAGANVVGDAAEAEGGLALAQEHQPDVIVLDEKMPGRSGSEALPDFRRVAPTARIVLYTAYLRESVGRDGADSYVEKTAPPQDLIKACFPDGN